MTIENDFLTFACQAGSNVVSQAAYAALNAQQTGFQAGLAPSAQCNKVWRQGSIMASVLAQFITQQSGQAAIDDGTTATLLANLTHAVATLSGVAPKTILTGTSHVYAAADAQTTTWRQNSGGLMTDTLPGAPGSLPTGWTCTIVNADPTETAMLAVTAAPGATLFGSNVYNNTILLGPGQQMIVVYDGVNYQSWGAPIRAKIGANLTIFVSTAGSDALNHGLTTGAPFASIQRAISFAQQVLDVNGFQVICQLATVGGATTTYAGNVIMSGYLVGQALPTLNYGVSAAGGGSATVPPQSQYGAFVISGNASNPALTVITNSPGATAAQSAVVRAGGQSSLALTNVTLTSNVLGMVLLLSDPGSAVCVGAGCVFGAVAGGSSGAFQIWCSGVVYFAGSYSITSSCQAHLLVNGSGAKANYSPVTVSIIGGVVSGGAFYNVSNCGSLYIENATFNLTAGSVTGQRWGTYLNGTINTNTNGNPFFLPGTSNGGNSTGGEYF